MAIDLPFPHGTGVGKIGEKANINSNPIPLTTHGMMVDPGSDGLSAQANRGTYAVSANIEHLRGFLNASKAKMTTESFTAAPDAWIGLTGEIFIGMNAYSHPKQCFQVLDSEGNELVVDDEKIVVIEVQTSLGAMIWVPGAPPAGPAAGSEFETDARVVFGQESNDAPKSIPINVDYTVVYGIENTVGELDIDGLVEIPIQHAQEMDGRQLRTWDHNAPNSCIGAPPALTYNAAAPPTITWTAFYCIVKGRIFYVPAGVSSTIAAFGANEYGTLYIDQWGVMSLSKAAVADPPAVNPEDNLILGHGLVNGVPNAWVGATPEIARSLTSKPTYVTVGRSAGDKCNFEDLADATAFVGYLYNRVANETDLVADAMELPRILITSAVTVAGMITLTSPVWIEGVDAFNGDAITTRHPRIEYDLDVDVIDCAGYKAVVKELDVMYTDAAADRADSKYTFKDVGHNSVFDHVRFLSSAAFSSSGAISVQGRQLVIRDCVFDRVSKNHVAGTPAIYLQNNGAGDEASEATIEHCRIEGRGQANEVLLSAEGVDNLAIRDCVFADTGGFSLMGADAAGPVNMGRVVISGCDIAGVVSFEATDLIVDEGCEFSDISVEFEMCGVNGVHTIKDSKFVYFSVHVNPGVATAATKLKLKNNRCNYSGSAAAEEGIRIYATNGGVDVIEIDGNEVQMESDNANISGLIGIKFDYVAEEKTDVVGNRVVVQTDHAGGGRYVAGTSSGIYFSTTATTYREVHLDRNHIFFAGDNVIGAPLWAAVFTLTSGIRFSCDNVNAAHEIWCRDNNVVCSATTIVDQIHHGILLYGVKRVHLISNRISGAFRGIVVFPKDASAIAESVTAVGNHVIFGAAVGNAAANWEDSAAGIIIGLREGANVCEFDTLVVGSNTVHSVGAAAGAVERHAIHGEVRANGQVVFHNNIIMDPDGYGAGGANPDLYGWYFDIAGAAIDSTNFRPSDHAAALAGANTKAEWHNIAYTGSAISLNPA